MTTSHSVLIFLILPMASSLVARLGFRTTHNRRTGTRSHVRTSLSLGTEVTDILASHHSHHSALIDILSTSLSPGQIAAPIPNQSLPPLSETIKLGTFAPPSEVTIIPDQIALPGGTPRSGNPLIVESFRDLFNGPIKASTATQSNIPWNGGGGEDKIVMTADAARELDIVGRYADLLNRIPLAAAIYALVDFFFVNAEEDVAIAEMLDDTEGDEIMEMEASVVKTRFLGLFVVVMATVVLSNIIYHPVPFNQLRL